MNKKYLLVFLLLLGGCINKPPSSEKIFSNAQVQYQTKDSHTLTRKSEAEMPSYFFELNYEPHQIALNKAQETKIQSAFKKIVYPEEYHLYVSFGTDSHDNLAALSPLLKRAEFIKSRYSSKVKSVKIAYLKNQPSNSAYFRLIT